MIPNRIKIPKVEFYITNVCNLTCEDCNRFNNHDFKGWQAWSDYKHIYQQWAQYVEPESIVILGGEPLLNPTLSEWVRGLNKLWDCNIQILTNGTRINHVRGLYDLIRTSRCWMGVSLHDKNYLPELEKELSIFLKKEMITYDRNHPRNRSGSDVMYGDGTVHVSVWIQDEFMESAIKIQPNGKFTLHSSDPVKAHESCPIAQNKSYHFIRGKLYKCGPVALFPEFDQQHKFDISDSDRTLLNEYQPLTVDDFKTRSTEFLANIDNPIPQCKFCPDRVFFKKIISIRKGLDQQ